MAYTAWSVVFGEQPTAAKWNQLGANDAGFKDGTNIDAGAITNAKLAAGIGSEKLANPYKFSVYRASAFSAAGASPLIMDTKLFDTGTNYSTATGLFTVPVAGFYFFDCQITQTTGNFAYMWATIFKNGVEWRRGNRTSYTPGNGAGLWVMAFMSLNAGDTISFGFATNVTVQVEVGDQLKTVAEGFLVSKT